jgi:DSF synthase
MKDINEYEITRMESISYFYMSNCEAWHVFMQALPRPCMSIELVTELSNFCKMVKNYKETHDKGKFIVISSCVKDIFNLGGDIEYFKKLILKKDKDKLLEYGILCIDGLWQLIQLSKDLHSISIVSGTALGGGFELALACNYIIAENNVKVGFPEIKFNLFPGMGAYSFLARQVGSHLASKIILSGANYSAEEMHRLGIIDEIASPGEGFLAAAKYIQKENDKKNGVVHFQRAANYVNPITYEELLEIVKIWVEACLGLNEKDLRLIDLLVGKQYTKGTEQNLISPDTFIKKIYYKNGAADATGLTVG